MNIRLMKRINLCLLSVSLLSSVLTHGAFAQVKTEHPRIWLTDERIAVLQDRLARNTYNANYIRNWCATHINDDVSPYVTARASELARALNYAILYQANGDVSYARRAVEIIEYAFDHPYSGYDLNLDTWISYDNWYTTRYLVPHVALVLDWCYDWMSQSQRDRFIGQLDTWADMLIKAEPWAWHDPSNNYYFGYMWALTTTAYAIYGHNENAPAYLAVAKTMITEAVKYSRGEEVAWAISGNTTGRAKGGFWNEGTSYGALNTRWLCSSIIAVKDAEGVDYPDPFFTYYNEAIYAVIYGTCPDGARLYSDGDGAKGEIGDPFRTTYLFAVAMAEGDTKRYGQHWLNTITSNMREAVKLYKEFLWYDDLLEPLDYSGRIPDHYVLDGIQTVFWRSGWGQNDTWMAFKAGVLNTDHAHNGLGGFMIFKEGFLATDKAIETGETMMHGDSDHNCLIIPSNPGDYANGKLYWGKSAVEHFKSEPEYLYFAADISGPYLAQPDYRNNSVIHKEREFFLIKEEGVLAIMDRGTSFDQDKTFQIYLHNQAVPSGSKYVSSNGNAELGIYTAYPPGTVTSLETSGIPLIRVSTAAFQNTKTFVHLLKVSEPQAGFQARGVTVAGGLLAAGAFTSTASGLDYLVAFSNDPEGDTPSAGTMTLTVEYYTSAIVGYVADMTPNSDYYVSDSTEGANLILTISDQPSGNSGLYASNEEGVLYFIRYHEEDPLPTIVPEGVKIKK